MWLRLIMCMQTVSIKLGRSKGCPCNTRTHTHTHSILYTTLLIPPPYLPLHPFNRAIACSLIFSRCQVPPFLLFPCSIPSILNSHRVDWNPESSATPPSLPRYPHPDSFRHIGLNDKPWPLEVRQEKLELSQSRKECRSECISHIAWCAICGVVATSRLVEWRVFRVPAVCDVLFCSDFDEIVYIFWAEWWFVKKCLSLAATELSFSSTLPLHLALLSSFLRWEPTVGVERGGGAAGMWWDTSAGPRCSLHSSSIIYIHLGCI